MEKFRQKTGATGQTIWDFFGGKVDRKEYAKVVPLV
jgi:hypothetical protein